VTTIGLIGSGNIGSTVARLAVDAGHDVVLSNSRGPETLTDLVDQLGRGHERPPRPRQPRPATSSW
jgi:predicted dinucleotide-binding enzyme